MANKAFFSIEFQGGKETILEIDKLKAQLKSVANDINNAKKAGDKGVYKNLILEQSDLRKELKDTNTLLRQQQNQFDKVKYPTDSVHGLELQYSKLRQEIRGMGKDMRDSVEGKTKIKFAAGIKQQILDIDGSINDFKSNIGNYKSAFKGLGDLVTGGLFTGGFLAAGAAAAELTKQLFSLNSEIDGIQAGVRKTTGLTVDQVENLTTRLAALDTSTTLQELLAISTEAGRFGVTGEDAIYKFTNAVNILNIALGDEFKGGAEEVTNVVAKLSNVLYGVTTDGEVMATNFQHIGNALNVLANNGSASAGEIADVASRIGGLGKAIGLTQGDILGVSSAIVEMGINVERGGTAFNTLNQKMRANIDKFSKATGIAKDDLQKMLDTKPMEALNLVIKKLVDKSGGSASNLVATLSDLGLKGSGVSEIFFKWAQNSELVNQRLKDGNQSIGQTNSLLAEQKAMMDSIPSQWQRFKNALSDVFVSSGLQSSVKNLLSDTNDFLAALDKWNKNKITFKELLSVTTGDRSTREQRLNDLVASKRTVTDVASSRGSRTYYDSEGRPFKLTSNGRQYIKEQIKGEPDNGVNNLTRSLAKDHKKKGYLDPKDGSIGQLEKAYNDLMAAVNRENNPKALEALVIKSIEAKKKLDEAKKALEELQNANSDEFKSHYSAAPLEKISDKGATPGIDTPAVDTKGTLKMTEAFAKDLEQTKKANSKKEKENFDHLNKLQEQRQRYTADAIYAAQSLADGIFALNQQSREQEEDGLLDQLDKETQARIKAANGNAALEEAIREDSERKKLEIQKEYFEKDKKAKIAQALINAALAIIQAFAQLGPIAGAIAAVGVGITTGFQIAQIKNQKFAKGGFTGNGLGERDDTGKRVAGIVHENEYVGSEEQIRRYPRLFQALEVDRLKHLRGYAEGGFTTTAPNFVSPSYYSNTTSQFSDDQISQIAAAVRIGAFEGASVGAKQGSEQGAREGAYMGNMESQRLKERITQTQKSSSF